MELYLIMVKEFGLDEKGFVQAILFEVEGKRIRLIYSKDIGRKV